MVNEAVTDTGPVLHLNEINLLNIFDSFSAVFVPPEILNEIEKNKIKPFSKLKVVNLNSNSKNIVNILFNEKELDLGESEAISLALQENINLFLTDDLDARKIAREYNLEVHGTLGIILRAFSDNRITKELAINKIWELFEQSSLFLTLDLVNYAVKSINNFKKIK